MNVINIHIKYLYLLENELLIINIIYILTSENIILK